MSSSETVYSERVTGQRPLVDRAWEGAGMRESLPSSCLDVLGCKMGPSTMVLHLIIHHRDRGCSPGTASCQAEEAGAALGPRRMRANTPGRRGGGRLRPYRRRRPTGPQLGGQKRPGPGVHARRRHLLGAAPRGAPKLRQVAAAGRGSRLRPQN